MACHSIVIQQNCYRKIQKALKTHGTFNLCHSFSTSADNPKFVAKFLACWYPLKRVLATSNDELHIAIFDNTSGNIAAKAGECLSN